MLQENVLQDFWPEPSCYCHLPLPLSGLRTVRQYVSTGLFLTFRLDMPSPVKVRFYPSSLPLAPPIHNVTSTTEFYATYRAPLFVWCKSL